MSRSSRIIFAFIFSLVLIGIGVVALVTTRQPEVATADQAALLSANLQQMRDGLSQFAKKNGRYPLTLEEMVTAGVIARIPIDPITRSNDTWRLIRETTVEMDDFRVDDDVEDDPSSPIVDIRSGASGSDPSGVAWSEY
ncbi:MAG TPA: hypothetical protein VMS12_03995 [Thermoanaerobaculia bacterium]|nr:hypothetical protein [Thermoanaerobaculia bacterium]